MIVWRPEGHGAEPPCSTKQMAECAKGASRPDGSERRRVGDITSVGRGLHGTRYTSAAGPRKTTRKAQAREEEIHRAAARIFHRKGYAATSLQDIADEVGILKGSLYYYIDGKEDLLFGITQTIHRLAAANADRAAAMQGSCADRLRFLVELHVASFGVHLEMIRVFYTEYAALGPERRQEVMA